MVDGLSMYQGWHKSDKLMPKFSTDEPKEVKKLINAHETALQPRGEV